jgi:hypothetical protein
MNKKNTGFSFVGIFVLFLLATPGLAEFERMPEEDQLIELTAKIMSMDLIQNEAIIAEKEIALKSHVEKGQKVWDTRFLDRMGKPISPELFKPRDRVKITGIKTKGEIVAQEIIMMD